MQSLKVTFSGRLNSFVSSVVPALLDSLPHFLGIFLPVILIQVRGLHVRRGRGVRIIKQRLDTCQNGGYIVSGRPSILEDIQAQFPGAVDIRVKHLRHELDTGGLVGVGFFELHDESECTIFEGRVCGTDDDGVPD